MVQIFWVAGVAVNLRWKHRLGALAAFVTFDSNSARGRLNAESASEPPLRHSIEVLQQVMCTHDAEKLAIVVLEVYEERKSPKQPTCYK